MDWRKFLEPLLFCSAFAFVMFMSDVWDGKTHQFGTHYFIVISILVISSSMGLVGLEELKQGGHKKARRELLVCLTVLLIIPLIVLSILKHTHGKMSVESSSDIYWFLPLYVLFIAVLPIALYLNRNQTRKTLQPTTDNAD